MTITNDIITFDANDVSQLSTTAQAALQVQADAHQIDVAGFLSLVVNKSITTNVRNLLMSQFLSAPMATQVTLAQQAATAANQVANPAQPAQPAPAKI